MRRYELTDVSRCGEPWREMEVDTEGDWVRREDAVTLLVRAEKAEAEVARLREGLEKMWQHRLDFCAELAALLEDDHETE